LTEFPEQAQTVKPGQVPIQDNAVIVDLEGHGKALFPVWSQIGSEILLFQAFDNTACDFGFIFNDQNAQNHLPPRKTALGAAFETASSQISFF
jgi:hypothetical protein